MLPHREAAWALLAERIDAAAAFCEPPGPGTDLDIVGTLGEVRATLTGIAGTLTAHLPARPAPVKAGEDLSEVLERGRAFYRTCAAVSRTDPVSSGLSDVARAAYLVLEHTSRSEKPEAEAARVTDRALRPLADYLGRDPAAGAAPPAESTAESAGETGARGEPVTTAELAGRAAADATGLSARLAQAARRNCLRRSRRCSGPPSIWRRTPPP